MYILETLLSILSCFAPLLIVGFIIWLIVKALFKHEPAKSNDINGLSLEWLKQKKSEGYTTIDQLISLLSPKQSEILSIQQPSNMATTLEAKNILHKDIKTIFTFSNSDFLMYLGSAIFLFAILIFSLFNWETFSLEVRTFIIISIPILFYLAGFGFSTSKVFQKVGQTFIMLGSILLIFSGLGLWNFGLLSSLSISFFVYWGIFSIVLCLIYIVTFLTTKREIYYYLFVSSIYFLFYSFSFGYVSDSNMSILLLTFLNLIFFAIQPLFKTHAIKGEMVSRMVNLLLDIVIIGNVFLLGQNPNSNIKFIAVLALLIPVLVDLYSIIRGNTFEIAKIALLSPIKIFVFSYIFGISFETAFLLSVATEGFNLIIVEIYQSFKKVDNYNFIATNLFMLGVMFLVVAFLWFLEVLGVVPIINDLFQTLSLFIIGVSLFSYFVIKNWRKYYFVCFAILALAIIKVTLLSFTDNLTSIIVLSIVVGLSMGIQIHVDKRFKNIYQKSLLPAIWLIPLVLLFTYFNSSLSCFVIGLLISIVSLYTIFYEKKAEISIIFILSFLFALWKLFEYMAVPISNIFSFSVIVLVALNISRLLMLGYKTQDEFYTKLKDGIGLSLLFVNIFFMLASIVFASYNVDYFLPISFAVLFFAILGGNFFDNKKYIAGFALVSSVLAITILNHLDIQFVSISFSLNLLVLAYIYFRKGDLKKALTYEFLGYASEFMVLFLQSLYDFKNLGGEVYYGLVLIVFASLVAVWGKIQNQKTIMVTGISFLVLELVIRLFALILQIPLWIYLAVFGLVLISGAIYTIWKVSKAKA